MNNFVSVFDELTKLYEEKDCRAVSNEADKQSVTEAAGPANNLQSYRVALADYEDDDGYDQEDVEYLLQPGQTKGDLVVDLSYHGGFMYVYVHDERPASPADIKRLAAYTFETTPGMNYEDFGSVDEEDWLDESLTEAAEEEEEIEIVDDEAAEESAEETPVDEEPKKLVLECSKCGNITCKEESEVTVDEESDLANVDVACESCEETAGYKILGELRPYEAAEAVEEALDEDELSDPALRDALTEGGLLGRVFDRKKDKPDNSLPMKGYYDDNYEADLEIANGTSGKKTPASKTVTNPTPGSLPMKGYFEEELEERDEPVEEGLFDFGKKKREAERKRQEEEEAARKAEQEKSKKSKWPTAADYDAYEREQREQRRIDAQMAKYKAMGQDWNKRADSTSPSNTPYAGVNYSGGDYF